MPHSNRSLLAALSLTLFASALDAQPTWMSMGGPPGGTIGSLLRTPAGVVFAATIDGAIYASTDEGTTWVARRPSISAGVRLAVAGSGTVIAGTSGLGIDLSSDGGHTWLRSNEVSPGPVGAIATAPDGTVVVGMYQSMFPPPPYGIILYTSNGWGYGSMVDRGITSFAFPSSTHWLAGTTYGMLHSTDSGHTWSPTGGAFVDTVFSLLGTPDGRVYAGTRSRGIFVSTDSGETWTAAGQPSSSAVMSLARSGDGTLVAGTLNAGIFRSNDHGGSWLAPAVAPASNQCRALMTMPDGSLLAGCSGDGIYRSTDQGETWTSSGEGIAHQRVASIAPFGTSGLWVAADGRIFRSNDRGATWTMFPSPAPQLRALIRTASSHVLVGTNLGVFESTTGLSWTEASAGLADLNVMTLSEAWWGTIYAGTRKGVFQSMDDGASWTAVNGGISTQTITRILPLRPGVMLAIAQSGVYRTGDDGMNWTLCTSGLSATSFNDMAADRLGRVYLAAQNSPGGGLFRSTDEGSSWTRMPPATHMESARGLLATSDGDLMTVWFDRVMRTSDGGVTWMDVGGGGERASATTTAGSCFAEDAAGYVYLSGGTGALHRTVHSALRFAQRDSLDFQSVRLNDRAQDLLTIVNPSRLPTTVTSIGAPDLPFESSDSLPLHIPPGDSIRLSISFKPTVFGSFDDSLRIEHSFGIDRVRLLGSSPTPTLVVTPTAGRFGDVARDSTVSASFHLLTSTINELVVDSMITRSPVFQVEPRSGRTHDSVRIRLTFRTDTFGVFEDTLVIWSNASPPHRRIPLEARSSLPRPTFPVSPRFAQIAIDDSSVCMMPIVNVSPNRLETIEVRTTLPAFEAAITGPSSLGRTETTMVRLVFQPVRLGIEYDTLRITSAFDTTYVPLTARSPHPAMWMNMITWYVDYCGVGDSVETVVRLSNLSPNPFTIDSLRLHTTSYALWAPQGPWTVLKGETLAVRLQFKPATPGTHRDTLLIWASHMPPASRIALRGEARGTTAASVDGRVIPSEFRLYQNYPNPFNPTTRFAVDIPREERVSMVAYAMDGRRVMTLMDAVLPAGRHVVTFDGAGLPSGVYVVRVHAGPWRGSISLVLLK